MADPQHPAVPFEQAVDLLTGEPRPLRPQHPDIAAPTLAQMPALIAKHDEFAALAAEHGHEEMAALHAVTAAALRFLTRPVEDEEVRDRCAALERIAAWADPRACNFAHQLREIASLLASLAREKASAEQEIARLRKFLRTSLAVVDESGNATADQIGILQEAERALAAAAGAEQPR